MSTGEDKSARIDLHPDERQCKICHKTKKRIFVGKFGTNNKDRKYVDRAGKMWNGRLCPSCNNKRAVRSMKRTRYKRSIHDKV